MHLPKSLFMMEEYNFRPSLKYCNRPRLVRSFCFDSRKLFDRIHSLEDGLGVSLSNIQYQDMAPFVGLDLIGENDIATFDLYRSRTPT